MKLSRHICTSLTAALILCAAMSGCKSSKKAAEGSGDYTPSEHREVKASGDLSQEAASLINSSRARAGQWQTLQVPVSMSLSAPMSFSASGTLSMVNGRTIDISVKLLGFEIASGHIEGDSITAVVKPARMYVAESISKALGGVAVNVSDLQAILLGALIDPTPVIARGASVDAPSQPDGTRFLTLNTSDMSLGLSFRFPAGRDLLDRMTFTSSRGYQGSIDFSDYTPVKSDTQLELPAVISLDGQQLKTHRDIKGSLRLNAARAKVNTSITVKPVTIPSDYRKVALSSLMKGL